MSIFKNGYEQLVNAIIRPPRREYDISSLGSPIFTVSGRRCKRTDLELTNSRDLTLQCSLYSPVSRPKKLPCVIYCHGNCGCRLDATDAIRMLLPMNICVFCFDFSGSGLSEGEYVTLGHFEKLDLETVIEYLRKSESVTRIALWGRSMGAVTSILYGVTDPSVACMILDSPFSSLTTLSQELIETMQIKLPKLMVKAGMKVVSRSVKSRAQLDINKLEPIKAAPCCFIPCLFVHGKGDDFIAPSHSEALNKEYAGDHNLILIDGDHNSQRPRFFYDSASIFFSNNLLIDSDFGEDNPIPTEKELEQEVPSFRQNGGPLDFQAQLEMAQQESIMASLLGQGGSDAPNSVVMDEEEQIRQAILLSLQEANGGDASADVSNADDSDTKPKSTSSEQQPKKKKESKSSKKSKSKRSRGDKKTQKEDKPKPKKEEQLISLDDDSTEEEEQLVKKPRKKRDKKST